MDGPDWVEIPKKDETRQQNTNFKTQSTELMRWVINNIDRLCLTGTALTLLLIFYHSPLIASLLQQHPTDVRYAIFTGINASAFAIILLMTRK